MEASYGRFTDGGEVGGLEGGLFEWMLNRLEASARRADRIDFAFAAVDGPTALIPHKRLQDGSCPSDSE